MRAIEPVFVSRGELDKRVKNELEGVVVKSLAGIIKELSSFAKHADNLFGELFFEATNINQRAAVLTQRVDELYQHVREMDSTVKDDVKVEDIVAMNHFKSSRKEDQCTLSRDTLPTALQEVRFKCETPPALNEFTRFRDDQKDGLSFYTDSTYFYRLWVEEQNQLLEKKTRRERRRRRKKDHKPKKKIQAVQKKVFIGADAEFLDEQALKLARHSQVSVNTEQQNELTSEPFVQAETMPKYLAPDHAPPMDDPSKPGRAPPTPPMNAYSTPPSNSPQMVPKSMAPPPPPPSYPPSSMSAPPPTSVPQPRLQPYPGEMGYSPAPPPPQEMNSAPSHYTHTYTQPSPVGNAPAAPPPPPVNILAPPPPPIIPPANLGQAAPGGGGGGRDNKPSPSPADNRSDLLSAIRCGKQLQKVERTQVEKKTTHYDSDVACILARRIAVEVSDSESRSEYSDSDSYWSD